MPDGTAHLVHRIMAARANSGACENRPARSRQQRSLSDGKDRHRQLQLVGLKAKSSQALSHAGACRREVELIALQLRQTKTVADPPLTGCLAYLADNRSVQQANDPPSETRLYPDTNSDNCALRDCFTLFQKGHCIIASWPILHVLTAGMPLDSAAGINWPQSLGKNISRIVKWAMSEGKPSAEPHDPAGI